MCVGIIPPPSYLFPHFSHKFKYLWCWICKTPALRSWSSLPDIAMAPKAVPLKSKWKDSWAQGLPGHWSVITTVTGFPEHAAFELDVHFT